MMTQRGFSLIEMLIVIALISILSAAAWFSFSAYSRKSTMEREIHTLYGDLMEARTTAVFQKKVMKLEFTTTSYTIYADGVAVETRSLHYPIEVNTTSKKVEFNTFGFTTDLKSICLTPVNEAVVDAIVISETRIQLGKKDQGASCGTDHITAN